MRDFAVAAGIAASAFGAPAAAPLGIYGILVLVFGSAAVNLIRRRPPPTGQAGRSRSGTWARRHVRGAGRR